MHTISVTNAQSDVDWSLYDDPAFVNEIFNCDNSNRTADEVCDVVLQLRYCLQYGCVRLRSRKRYVELAYNGE